MGKKMLINASHPEENRVAIVVDGILSELDIEIAGQEQSKGNIYKAVVVRVETGLQAAFVDYGAEKPGFLQIGEVNPQIYPPKDEVNGRPRIADLLQRGQEIMVQIVKEERGNKGAALTTYLSIPGRYMVLMPDSTTKGVSRKINIESERKSLKRTMAELELPERMGYIVRTAGIGKDKEELKRDFDYLVRLFEGIVGQQDKIKAPAQLYQESNLAIRSIRDYFSTDMDEVLIDDAKVFQDTRDFFSLVMPELKHLVKRHRERRPIFSRYQIEEQIEGLSKNQSPLPSGGSIVLDQTEALVAIDVNSGKMSGESGIEATAYKTNLEAAKEVGRQLRLRDLGGLVVIDFIDMRDRKNIREIEQELNKALKDDKAKVSIGRISKFGLMEMSRQRLKPVLSVGAYIQCPNCQGLGQIKSIEAQAVSFLRQAHTAAAKGQIGHIEASVPIEVANYLLNKKRSTITKLEQQLRLQISLIGRCDLRPGDAEIVLHKREKQTEDIQKIVPVSHDNQIENALAAAKEDEQVVQEQPQEPQETIADKPEENALTQDKEQETTEKSKPRRRRRRKKPATSSTNVTDESQATAPTDNPAPEPQPEPVVTDIIEATTKTQSPETIADTQVAPETPVEEKPKPRPRRRSRKKPTPAVATAKDESTAPQDQVTLETVAVKEDPLPNKVVENTTVKTTAPVPTSEPAEKATIVTEKPKRRPRRTPKKITTDTIDAVTATTAVATNDDVEKGLQNKTAVNAEKPQTKPRKTTKKVPTKSTADPTVTTKEDADVEAKPKRQPRKPTTKKTAATTTETITKKKPQTRTRKPATPKTDTIKTTTTTTDTEKPKRQPRKVTKTTTKTSVTDDGTKTPDLPTEKVEKKPQRRTRKTPIKKNEVDDK